MQIKVTGNDVPRAARRNNTQTIELRPEYFVSNPFCAQKSLYRGMGSAATSAWASSRFSSGMQEPQLVPVFSCAPIAAAEPAPAAIASQIVARPTPKQAQTVGPLF